MLPLWIAAGIIALSTEPSVGNVVAVQECTVAASRRQPEQSVGTSLPYGAYVWDQPFDPGDHVPYALDFGPLLDEGEKLAAIVTIRMSAAAAALGVAIDQSSGYAPVIDDEGGGKVQVWPLVASETQEAVQFDATGTRLPVTIRVLTDASPPKRFERTAVLIMRQQ